MKYIYVSVIVLARWSDGKGVTRHSRDVGNPVDPKNWSQPHQTAVQLIKELTDEAFKHGETVLSASHTFYIIDDMTAST